MPDARPSTDQAPVLVASACRHGDPAGVARTVRARLEGAGEGQQVAHIHVCDARTRAPLAEGPSPLVWIGADHAHLLVRATAQGHREVDVPWIVGPSDTVLALALYRSPSVALRVVSPARDPVQDVLVTISLGPAVHGSGLLHARTDVLGMVEFVVPAQAEHLRVVCAARHPNYAPSTLSLELAPQACTVRELMLASGSALSLALPASWASVRSTVTVAATTVDAGTLYFDAVAADCAEPYGGRVGTLPVGTHDVVVRHYGRVLYRELVTMSGGTVILHVAAAPPPTKQVRAVVDGDKPLAQVSFRAFRLGRPIGAAITGSDGEAQIALDAPDLLDVWMCAIAPGGRAMTVACVPGEGTQLIQFASEALAPVLRLVDSTTAEAYEAEVTLEGREAQVAGAPVIRGMVNGAPLAFSSPVQAWSLRAGGRWMHSRAPLAPGMQTIDVRQLAQVGGLTLVRGGPTLRPASIWLHQVSEQSSAQWHEIRLPEGQAVVEATVDLVESTLYGTVDTRWVRIADLAPGVPWRIGVPVGLDSSRPRAILLLPSKGLSELVVLGESMAPVRWSAAAASGSEVHIDVVRRADFALTADGVPAAVLELEPGSVVDLREAFGGEGYLVRADWARTVSTCSILPSGRRVKVGQSTSAGHLVHATGRHLLSATGSAGERLLSEFADTHPHDFISLPEPTPSRVIELRDLSGAPITGEMEVLWTGGHQHGLRCANRIEYAFVLGGAWRPSFQVLTPVHVAFLFADETGRRRTCHHTLEPKQDTVRLRWEEPR